MAKMITPAVEKHLAGRARAVRKGGDAAAAKSVSPTLEAWRRLRRNKLAVAGLVVIILFVLVAIFADVIAPYGMDDQDYTRRLIPPCSEFILGTDNFGRDIFSRIVYGARVSLPIGIACSVCSLLVGGFVGICAAYFGGWFEDLVMRIMDIFQSIPATLLSIAILAALGNGMPNLILANTIALLPAKARATRGAIYMVKENDYIEASRAVGAGSFRQMFRHMLPNALGPIIIGFTMSIAGSILVVSGLSYLGLGIVAPTAEWGAMLSNARDYIISAPYYIVFPGIAIIICVFSINLFGDGLRDALDPRLK